MSVEEHKIVFKTDYSEQKRAEAEHKAFLEREKADNKIRIENEKRITITKGTESKIRVEQAKTEARLTVLAEQEAIKQRIALARQEAAEKKKAAAFDSKLTGQSTTLGSLGAVDQQLKYYTGLRNAAVTNSAEFSRYSSKVRELNLEKKNLLGTTGSLTSSLATQAAGYIGLTMAIQKAIQFTRQSITAFAEDELAVSKLRLGLNRLGEGDYLGRLIQQQTQLQATTFFNDTQIANAQAMLTSFKLSGKEIEILTPRLLDMATQLEQTGQGTADLQQLAIQLGKATGGELVGGLKRYGVIMTKTQEEQLKLVSGLERTTLVAQILDNNFSGLATNMQNTTAFQINYMTKALEELKEGFGAGLVSNIGNTSGAMEDGSRTAEQMAEDLQTVKDVGETLAKVMSGRWILSFEKWQKSLQTGIGDTLTSWLGLKSNMEVPITPSVSLSLVDNAIRTIQQKYAMFQAMQEPGSHDVPLPPNFGYYDEKGTWHKGIKPEKKTRTSSPKSSTVKEVQEELNLVKLLQAEQVKLQAQYDKNIGDLGAQNDLRLKMLDIEREIFRLRTGSDISFKTIGEGQTINYKDLFPEMIRPGYKRSGFGGEESTEDYNRRMEEAEAQRLQYAQQINSEFFNILNTTGLINTEFGRIIQMLKAAFDTGSSAIGLIGSIVGFFAGGPVGSVIGGIGGGGALSAGLPGSGSGINRAMNTVRGSSQAPKYDFMVSNTIGGVAKLIIYEDGKAISEKLAVSEL